MLSPLAWPLRKGDARFSWKSTLTFIHQAYTARAVAGMICDLGLLNRDGIECFYPIFKDMQNWMEFDYEDQFPTLPFSNKPKGARAQEKYAKMLVEVSDIHRTFQV